MALIGVWDELAIFTSEADPVHMAVGFLMAEPPTDRALAGWNPGLFSDVATQQSVAEWLVLQSPARDCYR